MIDFSLNNPNPNLPANAFNEQQETQIKDPRPDIKEDSNIWIVLLIMAYLENQAAYGALHGIRCLGSKLSLGNREEGLIFHFPAVKPPEKALIKQYAQEHREYIKSLFKRIWRGFMLKDVVINGGPRFKRDLKTKKWVRC